MKRQGDLMKHSLLNLASIVMLSNPLAMAQETVSIPLPQPISAPEKIETGSFNMLPAPAADIDLAGCIEGFKLILDHSNAYPGFATLTNAQYGSCRGYAIPYTSFVSLYVTDAGCGSRKYLGSYDDVNDGLINVEIIDHRTRRCRDFQPAQIIYQTFQDGQLIRKLYSHDIGYTLVVGPGVIQDLEVTELKAIHNPANKLVTIKGRVMIGSNGCTANNVEKVALIEETVEQVKDVRVEITRRKYLEPKFCPMNYMPVYENVAIQVELLEGRQSEVLIHDVDFFGHTVSHKDYLN